MDEKSTHLLALVGGGTTRVHITSTYTKNGRTYHNVVTSPRSKLYREGTHSVVGVPSTRLKPLRICGKEQKENHG